MSNVLIGAGLATGMAFRAPKGTVLPTSPMETLSADWVNIGAVAEDGVTLTLPSGDVLRNWAMIAERKINNEAGKIAVPFMYTDDEVLKTLFGASNVTEIAATATHGNVVSVEFATDVSAEPAAYLFLMKDGDKLAMLGSSDALITDIADVTFNASNAANWNATIEGNWTFAIDDGQTV